MCTDPGAEVYAEMAIGPFRHPGKPMPRRFQSWKRRPETPVACGASTLSGPNSKAEIRRSGDSYSLDPRRALKVTWRTLPDLKTSSHIQQHINRHTKNTQAIHRTTHMCAFVFCSKKPVSWWWCRRQRHAWQ